MKSFYKARPDAGSEPVTVWQPLPLNGEEPVMFATVNKEHIENIFRKPEPGSIDQLLKGGHANLHSAEMAEQICTAWNPGNIQELPALTSKVSTWSFAELPVEPEPEPDPELESVSAPVVADVFFRTDYQQMRASTEKEVANMLVQARQQAEEIILAAQAEADNVLLQVQDEIDQQKREGFEQGRAAAESEFKSAIAAIQGVVGEVQAWQESLTKQAEPLIVEMVKDISLTMFGEGVRLDTTALQINLNRVMESAQGLGALNIFLNPRDARQLDPSWSEYQEMVTGDRVKIIPSEKITSGGCLIKGNTGIVDGRVETQLKAILQTIADTYEAGK